MVDSPRGRQTLERLFIRGATVVPTLAALYFILWSMGVVPASAKEREFMSLLRGSELAQVPQVSAALAAADDSLFVSRQHFWAAESAFLYSSVTAIREK